MKLRVLKDWGTHKKGDLITLQDKAVIKATLLKGITEEDKPKKVVRKAKKK